MKQINLSIDELNAETITNLYLYGKKDKPSFEELKSGSFMNRENITLYVSDIDEYMKSFGRFANASQIEKVSNFFSDDFGKNVKKGERKDYELNEIPGKRSYSFKQVDFKGKNEKEWAERTYMFNTQLYFLTKNAKFVIDENGNKYIENFAILPGKEDFDFKGGSWIVDIGNSLIKNDIDPYNIGKTLKITYPSYKKENINNPDYNNYGKLIKYSFSDYKNDIKRYDEENYGTYIGLLQPMSKLVDKLWDNGTTKFIDDKGKTIVYGSENSDILSTENLDGKIKFYYNKNRIKGIHYIGGSGSDTIKGTEAEDILEGGDGNDTLIGGDKKDTMFGGKGFDTYYAGDKDIIEDSDGKGEVHFNNINLTGAKEKVK
ncbi:hypothetical protein CRN67_08940, partial [Campylobacter blaseri]